MSKRHVQNDRKRSLLTDQSVVLPPEMGPKITSVWEGPKNPRKQREVFTYEEANLPEN